MARIGIIAVVYNQKQHLKSFFYSLNAQIYKNFTVYFIDNNSRDGSYDYARKLNESLRLDIKYINLSENTGYAAGSNAGAKVAIRDGCKYLFILNNDMVVDKNCIDKLVKLMESGNSTVCSGPLILFNKQPDIIQELGGKINFRFGLVKKYYTKENINNVKLPEIMETDFISGGAMFIKSSVFKNAGMFEESYFAYFDEIDLIKRIKSSNRNKMYVISDAIVWHNHNWTKNNKKSYYIEYFLMGRNKYLYYHKHRLRFSMFVMIFIDIVKFPWRLIWFMKVCDFKLGMIYLRGMLDGLLNRQGKPKFSFFTK